MKKFLYQKMFDTEGDIFIDEGIKEISRSSYFFLMEPPIFYYIFL